MNQYYRKLNEIKVACIFDEFTYACFKDICNFRKIHPDTWKDTLEVEKPDFLMVESAWSGNNNTWGKMVEENSEVLQNLVNWCKNNNIPTVFWNKEDPVHFSNFINVAKSFDYIFTTDENMVDEYKKYVTHDNIYVLSFAANPQIHSPIKIFDKRIDKYCFPGTYYQYKYEDRKVRMAMLFDLALKNSDLVIYDRVNDPDSPYYRYPLEYQAYIEGNLKQSEIQLAYKGYKVMLNVNIVTDSETMFSRRIYESLASLTPVVSTCSTGVEKVFNNLVVASDDKKVLEEEMIRLKDKDYYEKKALQGMRLVLNEHTSVSRIKYILDLLEIKYDDNTPNIAMVVLINKKEEFKRAKEIFERQKYNNLKLYITSDGRTLDEITFIDEKIYKLNRNTLNNKEELIKTLNCDYVSFININNYYGSYYINDLINATQYTQADVIGKKNYFRNKYKLLSGETLNIANEDMDFQYVSSLDLDRSILKVDILKNNNIHSIEDLIIKNKIDLFRFGYEYFSIDKFNFIENGYELNDVLIKKVNI